MGRFITPDTIVPDTSNPQAFNRYSYAGNNPVNHLEDGHGWFKKFFGQLIGAIAGAVSFVASGFNPVVGISVYSAVSSSVTAAINGAPIGQALGIGLVSGLVSYGVGSFVGSAATGFLESAFWGSVIGGGVGGAAGAASGTGLAGGDAGRAALAGLAGGALGGAIPGFGAILGGAASAEIMGGEAWEGAIGGAIYMVGGLVGNAIASGPAPQALNVDVADGVEVDVGSRPVGPGGLFRHRLIKRPDGKIVEMGPDANGRIKVFEYDPSDKNSRNLGGTPKNTIDAMNANKIRWTKTTISNSGLTASVNNYKTNVEGSQFYYAASHNSNNFVNTMVYSSAGQVPSSGLGYTPGFPDW